MEGSQVLPFEAQTSIASTSSNLASGTLNLRKVSWFHMYTQETVFMRICKG